MRVLSVELLTLYRLLTDNILSSKYKENLVQLLMKCWKSCYILCYLFRFFICKSSPLLKGYSNGTFDEIERRCMPINMLDCRHLSKRCLNLQCKRPFTVRYMKSKYSIFRDILVPTFAYRVHFTDVKQNKLIKEIVSRIQWDFDPPQLFLHIQCFISQCIFRSILSRITLIFNNVSYIS